MLAFIVFSVVALAVGRFWWLGHWIGRTVVTITIGGGLAFIRIMFAPGSGYGLLVALAALVLGYVIGSSRYWYTTRSVRITSKLSTD